MNCLGVKLGRAVWSLSSLQSILHASILSRASVIERNHDAFRYSARRRALNVSIKALSVVFPA